MDRKPFSSNKGKGGKSRRKGIKNAGFIALLILCGLIGLAAYGQSGHIEKISVNRAIAEANRGDYRKVEKKDNELLITTRKQKGDASHVH
jgi:hypothetical protein